MSRKASEVSYIALLLISNLVALIFLGSAFLNASSKYGPVETYFRLAGFGFVISLLFALVSFTLSYIFKIFFSLPFSCLFRFFVIQLAVLFGVYIVALLIIYH
jgi:hypothetical protein